MHIDNRPPLENSPDFPYVRTRSLDKLLVDIHTTQSLSSLLHRCVIIVFVVSYTTQYSARSSLFQVFISRVRTDDPPLLL